MEQWKDIIGFEHLYKISNKGNVLSKRRNKLMTHCNNNGYKIVGLRDAKNKKYVSISIHRLIAIHFIPNPLNYPMVNHKNGIKYDNRVENLEWCNQSMNMQHASLMNLIPKGEKNYLCKLSDEDVKEIRLKHKEGMGIRAIAREYGISIATSSKLINNKYRYDGEKPIESEKIYKEEIIITYDGEEEWRPIEGYDDYAISNKGNVFSFKRNIYLALSNNAKNYKVVVLSKRINGKVQKLTKLVHRLVAEAFIPNINNKPNIHHIDANPSNNRVDNLIWCTQQENVIFTYQKDKLKQL